MIPLPDVDSLMAGGLGDWLDSQRGAREATRAKIRKIAVWAVIIGGAIALLAWFAGGFGFAYFVGALVSMGGLAWTAYLRQQMVDTLKQQMNGALARALEIEYAVGCEAGAEFELAQQYSLLPDHDDAHLQDRWQGKVGGTEFLLYEAKLTETRGSGKNRRTVTVFQGIALRFRFARDFLGTTLVRRDGFKFTLFGDSKSFGDTKLDRLKMVDPRFEDAFDVYGSDPVEGRYLVHPAYCERLLELESSFAGEKLCALFHKGDLLVSIQTEDLFESATLDPSQDRELLGRTIDQFAAITRLIAALNERVRG